jgi:hypothetical protein
MERVVAYKLAEEAKEYEDQRRFISEIDPHALTDFTRLLSASNDVDLESFFRQTEQELEDLDSKIAKISHVEAQVREKESLRQLSASQAPTVKDEIDEIFEELRPLTIKEEIEEIFKEKSGDKYYPRTPIEKIKGRISDLEFELRMAEKKKDKKKIIMLRRSLSIVYGKFGKALKEDAKKKEDDLARKMRRKARKEYRKKKREGTLTDSDIEPPSSSESDEDITLGQLLNIKAVRNDEKLPTKKELKQAYKEVDETAEYLRTERNMTAKKAKSAAKKLGALFI